jgi:hypothetical protein
MKTDRRARDVSTVPFWNDFSKHLKGEKIFGCLKE